MAMSTADSYINASSVLFSNDFCKPLNIGKKGNEGDLLLSRIFALRECCNLRNGFDFLQRIEFLEFF